MRALTRDGLKQIVLAGIAIMAVGTVGSGQVQPREEPPGQEQPKPDAAKPAAPEIAAPVDPNTYKIGAEDVLLIRVWREPDLSGQVVVRPDGRITLPLVGDVEAAGVTPVELSKRLSESMGKFLNKPQVNVAVMSVQSRKYYISGQVSRSGAVPLVTPVTVLEALSSAGLGEWAKKNKIVIMRGTQRFKFNYNEVIKGKNLEQNITIQSGDHIFVP
jgi:polysaccharide export outer membrane protein